MPRHSFVQMTKLTDVCGRVDYITNPKRQEHLYATYTSVKPEYWKLLSKQSQFDFWRSHQSKGKCIEGRELVIALPEHLQQEDPDKLLQEFTKKFQDTYGMQCTSALHHNKAKTNYHIHLIFSERVLLEKPIVKIASRNMFFDEEGRHVRTKKQILDADGNVRPGCKILRKGLPYEMRYFSERKEQFKERSFLPEVKAMYTDLINQHAHSEQEKQKVFDSSGPYLPTKKIGKNNPLAEEIRKDNELRKEWNQSVDQLLIAGVSKEEVIEFKREQVTQKVAESVKANGRQPGLFAALLQKAIDVLHRYLKILMRFQKQCENTAIETANDSVASMAQETVPGNIPQPVDSAVLQHAKAEYMYMQRIHERLDSLNRKAYAIGKTIDSLARKLDKISGNIFHIFEKRELEKEIAAEKVKLKKTREQIQILPKEYGYATVSDFETAFRVAESEYKKLLKADEKYREWREASSECTDRFHSKSILEDKKDKDVAVANVKKGQQTASAEKSTSMARKAEPSDRPSRSKKSVLTRLAEKQEIVDHRKQQGHNHERRREAKNRDTVAL